MSPVYSGFLSSGKGEKFFLLFKICIFIPVPRIQDVKIKVYHCIAHFRFLVLFLVIVKTIQNHGIYVKGRATLCCLT